MRLARRVSCTVFASVLLFAGAAQAQVRISQIYGGGGNSGATYTNDFIELFNAGSSAVDLSSYSVQYASAAGTSWSKTNLSGSIQPGGYYLIQQAQGAGGTTPLPTPDATGTLLMSATAGKVVLISTQTTVGAVGCPTLNVVDFVPFGTGTTNCSASTPAAVAAPAPSNSNATLRKTAGCTSTGNNANDFAAGAPTPRNSASATNSCGGSPTPTNPTVAASLQPGAAQVGDFVIVRGTVVFGTNVTSTGVEVRANLTPIGGASNEQLFDDGNHDDGAAGDKVYGYQATVAAGTSAGSKSIVLTVTDAQSRSGTGSATLNVFQVVPIHDVQGNGNSSPKVNQTVAVEGIVTARRSTGFFIQEPDATVDADPMTSEGVFVFTGSGSPPPASAALGNRVRVLGTVQEYLPDANALSLTEISGTPSVTLLSTGNPLPSAYAITTALAAPEKAIDAMERLEGMRVSVATLNVVAPGGAFVDEETASSPTDGVFFGVLPGVARPFREEGRGALDAIAVPPATPVFDTNPERIRVQSGGQSGAIAFGVDVGDVVTGLVGVLDYGFGAYTVLPDPDAAIDVAPGATPTAVSVPKASEITIGGFNLERFFDDANDPNTSDPILTAEALGKRLRKTANAICAYVRTPDILGVVEVENLAVLQLLADHINAGDTQDQGACAKNPHYVPYLMEGNDIGGIDIGFLVNDTDLGGGVKRVEVLGVEQLGKSTMYTQPDGTSAILNDRPSLLLRARVHNANGASYEVTVIANHLRSLTGANGNDAAGARIRLKRAEQAKFLAQQIQARQLANPSEKIVLVGDFNAFEFNDGYADSMGIITGREAPATEVLNYVDSPVTTPLTNMASLSPAEERYSFSFDGNAQSLDHVVVNQALLDGTAGVRAEHARINSDFGEDNLGDFTVPVRVSDHDPVVLFLSDNAFGSADLAATVSATSNITTVGNYAGFGVGLANGGPDAAALPTLDLSLNQAVAGVQVQAPSGWNCSAPLASGGTTTSHCSGPTLAVESSVSLVVLVPTDREMGGSQLILNAKAGTATTDQFGNNNRGLAMTMVRASVDLASKVLAPKVVQPTRAPATFSVGISSGGPQDARGTVLALTVNGGPKRMVTAISSATLNCSFTSETPTKSTWTCPIPGWYVPGRSDSLTLTVDPAYAKAQLVTVGSGISSEAVDPATANNASAATLRVVPGLQ